MKSPQEIQEKYLNPSQETKAQLDNAYLHTQRCRFHAEGLPDSWWRAELSYINQSISNNTNKNDIGRRYANGYTIVLQKAFELLPIDKFHKFLANFSICTTNIVNRIKGEMQRVFFALNGSEQYRFKDDKLLLDWQLFRNCIANDLNDKEFFTTKGIELLLTDFNSLMIIDIESPKETKEETKEIEFVAYNPLLPRPYYKIIGIEKVYNICVEDNEIEFVVLITDDGYKYFDDQQVIEFDKDKNIIGEPYLHLLGAIPCNFVSNEIRFKNDSIQRKGILSSVLDELDNLVLFEVNARYMYFANAFPILYKFAEDCTYQAKQDFSCDGNNYTYSQVINGVTSFVTQKCACKESRLVGAGSQIEVPVPQEGVTPVMMPPVGQLTADVNALKFVSDKIAKDSELILNLVLGGGMQARDEQAKNELQVQGNFESRKATLMILSYSLQLVWNFGNNFCAKVRYADNFISGHIQLGDEFFLTTLVTLQEQFDMAKNRGDIAELQAIATQINYYKQKYNHSNFARAKVVNALNPFPYVNQLELLSYFQNQLISREEFRYILALPKLIENFEYNINADIVTFGENVSFAEKITKIKNELNKLFITYETENKDSRAITAE